MSCNDFGIWKNTKCSALHVVNRNDAIDNDWIVVLTMMEGWCSDGRNGYMLTVITDEWDDTGLIGLCYDNLDLVDLDSFIRRSIADYYYGTHGPEDRNDEWDNFFCDLEYDEIG